MPQTESKPEVTFWLRGNCFVVEAPHDPAWISQAKMRFGSWHSLRGHRGWLFERRLHDTRVRQMTEAAIRIFGVAPRIVDLDAVAA